MITCRLKGGLGNMMFQIAALENLSKKSGFETFYYNAEEHLNRLNKEVKHNPSLKHSHEYKKIFKNFQWNSSGKFAKTIKVPFIFSDIKIEDNICYDGFFQSEKYLDYKLCKYIFDPNDEIKSKLNNIDIPSNSCSIHIRRGDYVKLSHIHPTQDMQYYNKAMNIIKAEKYIIFSDDIEWCKNNFRDDKFIFIEEIDYIELFLQSKCSHNIISNSSFSWWGAYLNDNPNKKVIAPKKWFGNNKYNPKDIIPVSWVKL